jgi:phage host-nuclease inhibitor protein Gam
MPRPQPTGDIDYEKATTEELYAHNSKKLEQYEKTLFAAIHEYCIESVYDELNGDSREFTKALCAFLNDPDQPPIEW